MKCFSLFSSLFTQILFQLDEFVLSKHNNGISLLYQSSSASIFYIMMWVKFRDYEYLNMINIILHIFQNLLQNDMFIVLQGPCCQIYALAIMDIVLRIFIKCMPERKCDITLVATHVKWESVWGTIKSSDATWANDQEYPRNHAVTSTFWGSFEALPWQHLLTDDQLSVTVVEYRFLHPFQSLWTH